MLLLRFPPRFHPTITRQNMLQKGEEGKFSISIIFFFLIPPPPSLFSFNTIFEISLQACPDSLRWLMLISSQHLRVLKKTAPCVDNIPISKLINICTHNFLFDFFSLKFSLLYHQTQFNPKLQEMLFKDVSLKLAVGFSWLIKYIYCPKTFL